MDRIHDASCHILEKVGARVGHPRMLRVLEESGLPVDYERERVKFPRTATERFLDEAREKRERFNVPGPSGELPGKVSLSMGGGQALIYDVAVKSVRPACKRDLDEATIVGDYYPEIKSVSNLINPTDVPGPVNDIHMWDVLLRRTGKFGAATVTNKGSVKFIMEMLAVAVGSVEEVRKRRMFRKICFMFSPLTVPREELDVGFEMLDQGMGVVIGHAMPCMGIHAPITLAGALASVNAEALAGLIMTEALRQEFSLPYHCGTAVSMNPRTAISLAATPEFLQVNAACAELARYYGLGDEGFYGAGHTDSPVPNYQAGFEVGASMMIGVFCGCSRFGAGTLGPAHEVVCIPKIALDVDAVKYVNHWLRPIEVTEETLPVDAIIETMARDGNFIADEHTVKHIRGACWEPETFEQAKPSEHKDLLEGAHERTAHVLRTHDPHPLSEEQEREIARIVKRAEKAKGVN